MGNSIFRQEALDKLASPEQLDQLMKITSPKAWLALFAIILIMISILLWSFFGSLPTKIYGQGILLNEGGVYSIKHHSSGQVIDVSFTTENQVDKGDVIARIELPELIEKIRSLQNAETVSDAVGGSDNPNELKKQIEQLQNQLIYNSQIVTPINGRILEMNIKEGSVVRQGETIAVLEQIDKTTRLEAVLYVPAEQGEIQTGMEAHISPDNVAKEKYGFMMGRVTAVSQYPASNHSMMQTLENENLVSMLTRKGTQIKVEVDLIPDNSTQSGYKWSSPEGPPMTIAGGTLFQGSIIVKREKPIAKVIQLPGTTE